VSSRTRRSTTPRRPTRSSAARPPATAACVARRP
jgi:hypothetical protein